MENTTNNVLLLGKVGTGKSTFLKNFRKLTAKKNIVLSPTGVAAINVEGDTIHSFFHLPLRLIIPNDDESNNNSINWLKSIRYSTERKQIIMAIDILIIDEISMVRADVLDDIDMILRYFRQNDEPFGGYNCF